MTLAGRLFDFAFHFMNSAFNLILSYWCSSVFSLWLNNISPRIAHARGFVSASEGVVHLYSFSSLSKNER